MGDNWQGQKMISLPSNAKVDTLYGNFG